MHHEITCEWKGKMEFEGEILGHKIMLDNASSPDSDNKGASPKRLLLLAVAGCTGMDVVSMLAKMRVKLDGLTLRVIADGVDTDPSVYTDMKIIYQFRGEGLDAERDKLERAVTLSQEKYCGVSAMLQKAVKITTEIVIS